VRLHSTVALVGDSDWNESVVRASLTDFVRPGLTAGQLGVDWQNRSGSQELNGLWSLAMAVRGKYLFISDAPALLEGMIANMKEKTVFKPALFAAGLDHTRERDNFIRLTSLLDRSGDERGAPLGAGHIPEFFSENIASLSSTLAGVTSEKIVIRDSGDKVLQTVTYEWSH
jgi:hypothetical protein